MENDNNINYTCRYCKYWIYSLVIKRDMNPDSLEEKKKKKKKKKTSTFMRKCKYRRNPIRASSPSCQYFIPGDFWCDKFNCWMDVTRCLLRRSNLKGFKIWDDCRKCRQFEREIRQIAIDYYVNAKKVLEPKNKIIKRRSKKVEKRRSKKVEKRIIKRREKENERIKKSIKHRKIKRREKIK